MGIREYTPFEWRPLDELRRRYEEPLTLLSHPGPKKDGYRPRIVLEYLRDEDAANVKDYPHLQEQNRVRKVIIGNCRLLDVKMEKNGNFEFSAGKDDKYFECDVPRGAVNSGQEQVVQFKFKPPSIDPLLQDIGALKGIGQWVESVWECKINGGYVEPGTPDLFVIDIVLRAYVEQI